jgi:EAL domain-containing protein (putative c-di-GMP-specific phosphodiesterase class I)
VAANAPQRRPTWALPPRPPETWVGRLWLTGFLLAMMLAVFVPIAPVWQSADGTDVLLAEARAIAGLTAAVAAFALLVQSTVAGDRWLRWISGGYALALLLPFFLSGADHDLSVVEGLSLLTLAAVPLCAVALPLLQRGLPLLALPALALLAAAGALRVFEPALLSGTQLHTVTRLLWGLLALVAVAVSPRWLRSALTPRRWVGIGLALTAVAAGLHAAAPARQDHLWWAALAVGVLALAVPAVGVGAGTLFGYGRQSRRWRQLEAEVKALRRGSRLLEGRSITPEDEEGLPEQADVQAVLAAYGVRLALQPVVNLRAGTIVGCEALSRFGGRVPTDRWFKAASKHGHGDELERMCLAAALTLLPTLPVEQFLAVNVSPAALADITVMRLLDQADLHRVVVEITEHEAVEDYDLTRAALDLLRASGARIAVDDTGAGFASLRHVLMLQPDIIKLDIGLTRDVDVDRRQQALVRAVTAFAGEVGATVLAEGVETQQQLETLREIGVQLGQGWHLGVPVLVT